MATLTTQQALAAARKYTDETVIGGGALKGKNCVISSIEAITDETGKKIGNRVNFSWTLDDGTVKTDYMEVMNGEKGDKGDPGSGGGGSSYSYIPADEHLVTTPEQTGDFQYEYDAEDGQLITTVVPGE